MIEIKPFDLTASFCFRQIDRVNQDVLDWVNPAAGYIFNGFFAEYAGSKMINDPPEESDPLICDAVEKGCAHVVLVTEFPETVEHLFD